MIRFVCRSARIPVLVSLVATAEAFRASYRIAGAMEPMQSSVTRLHSSRAVHEQVRRRHTWSGAEFARELASAVVPWGSGGGTGAWEALGRAASTRTALDVACLRCFATAPLVLLAFAEFR
eukprot:scaffold596_cov236-Pinguiococcus_pyrenoidosus.AAC.14